MAGGRPILALVALILVAGGILLDIFVVLSGTGINVAPINLIYFLSANTQGIGSAPGTTAWTYFSRCTLSGSHTSGCGKVTAAPPFDPVRNFGTTSGVPAGFVGSSFYFYMSRVSWSFYLIALFFGAITLAMGIFACCARIAGFLSGFFAAVATLMQAVCAALMTAWTVKARNTFRAGGTTADLGRYAYGFTWASFACFFLAMILFCSSGGKRKQKKTEEEDFQQQPQYHQEIQQPIQPMTMEQRQPVMMEPREPVMMEQHQPIVIDQHPPMHMEPQHGGINMEQRHPIVEQPATGGFFGANKNRDTGIKDEYS